MQKLPWRLGALLACWGAVGAGCVWIGGRSAWFLFYSLGALLLYIGLHVIALRSAVAERSIQRETVTAGQDLEVTVQVKLSTWLPMLWVAVEESWTRQGRKYRGIRKLFIAGVRTKLRYSYVIPRVKRGQYQSHDLALYAGDLFGFYTKRTLLAAPLSFSVYPRVDAVMYAKRGMEYREGYGIRGIRDYITGDPLNRIHWKASAASSTWKTKLWESDPEEQVLIALDSVYPDEAHMERAVEVAAGYARAAWDSHCRVGIDCAGTELKMNVERSAMMPMLLRLLSVYDAPTEAAHESWLWELGRTLRNQTRLCLVTAGLDEGRMIVLERLRQHGVALSVLWIGNGGPDLRVRNLLRWLVELGCHVDVIRLAEQGSVALGEGGDSLGA